ncbi:MAG: mechanosensitive ion channel family protein [Phenylobacterium sp.]|uniref:mechanosensitive ion channel family protein n=1 Tax=Phenylobacterium sp. TaxID=1871053 RepID=UPI003918A2DD
MSFDTSDPAASVTAMVNTAMSGDPAVVRDLMGTLGAFSVRIVVAGLILAATFWASRRLSRLVQRALERVHKHHPADRTLSIFVGALVRYLVVAIGLIAVLQQLGIQATSILAVLGAASLAIGLALQGALSNVAAGVMLLILRPYRVGDMVELNGRQGTVQSMDLFNTKLLDFDGLTVYLPNGKIFGDMIVNLTETGRRRIELTFTVDYEDDLDLALSLLLEIARADPRVRGEPEPWAKVTGLADSGVNVALRCWADAPDWLNTRFNLVKAVKERFQASGLNFPYPHQVHIDRSERKVTAQVELVPAGGARAED